MITIVRVHQPSTFTASTFPKPSRFSTQHVKHLQFHMVKTKTVEMWHQTEATAPLPSNSLQVKLGLVYTWTITHPLHKTWWKVFPTFPQPSNNSPISTNTPSEIKFPQITPPNINKPLGSNKGKICQYICKDTRNAVHDRSKTNVLMEKSWMRLTTIK